MKYRVIQWATGSMGKTCLRAVIDHPDLELVGLFVYSGGKIGRDAGDIARRAPAGVIATNDIDEILALDADVVIHAPRIQFPYSHHNHDMCRLLASGKNLITINGHGFPEYHGAAYAAGFERACRQGNSSFFSTGLNPGFVAEKIAAVATGLCTKLDSIHIDEVFDVSGAPDHEYVFNICGMGSDPERIDLSPAGPVTELITGMYAEVIALLAFRLGMKVERVEHDHGVIPAPHDIHARAGTVRAGSVAATNWRWHGIVDGRRFITLGVNWIMGDTLPGYESRDHWKISLRGRPGIDITMNLVEPENTGERTRGEQYGVAGSVINAIPEVCAAPAGIFHLPVFASYRERF
ncbi:MAG TPA: dihydrodipicolinate reductase, partial [Spirochaetes bacterium]|nr:dihydrodipicolinate reductase [Spirochaetota bacterium]